MELKVCRRRAALALVAALALAAAAFSLPARAFADTPSYPSYLSIDTNSKTITVSPSDSDDDNEIQDALDYLNSLAEGTSDDSEGVEDGWTITVTAGTYSRFTVYNTLDNLTIQAADGAEVIISVLDGSDAPATTSGAYPETYGVSIRDCDNLTLDGLTFKASSDQAYWMAAAVSTYVETIEKAYNVTITNCDFIGVGYDYGIAFAENSCFTVTDCTFSDFIQGIYFEASNYGVADEGVTITGNTFTGCSFAIHGSFSMTSGTATGEGTFTFSNNKVYGSSSLRSKVVIQDSNGKAIGDVVIENNYFENAMVGLINEDNTADELFSSNEFDENSYVVIAEDYGAYDGTVSVYSNYSSLEDSHGFWVLTTGISGTDNELEVDWGGNPSTIDEYVKSVIAEANASGSHTLTFSVWDYDEDGDASDDVIKTFTWFKDAIYWVGSDEDEEEPGITKTADKSTAAAGETVTFSLSVSAPEYLDLYAELADIVDYPDGDYVSYPVTVHDVMNAVFELNVDSIAVSIDGTALDASYYSVTAPSLTDSCTFELTIDLAQLANAGLLVADEDGVYPDVVITYTATVEEGTAAGTYENTTWVTYETDGTSDKSTVEVQVQEYLDLAVAKAWDDSDDADGLRPDSVTVELYADGEATGLTVTLSEDNGWSASFEDLPVYAFDEDGNATEIEYTVVEAEVDGYESAVTGGASEGYTVTNTHEVTAAEEPGEETTEEEATTEEETTETEESEEEVLASTGDAALISVAVCAAAGAAAVAAGASKRRKRG